MELLIGTDPEFFLKQGGKNVSAHGMVEGTKEKPLPLKGGAVQVDGTALEFNIDPAKDKQQFLDNIEQVIQQVRAMVPEDYEFDFSPVARYPKKYYETIPEEALVLGCEPDYDAYTGKETEKPNAKVMYRTAAGHIHMGWTDNRNPMDPQHLIDCRMLAQAMDQYIGLPTAIAEGPNQRRNLYGKAGCFRPKPYGMEYRTPSNFWLQSKAKQEFVYKQATKCFNSLRDGTIQPYNASYPLNNIKLYGEEDLGYVKETLVNTKTFTMDEFGELYV